MAHNGRLTVLTGPSGVGKGTLVKRLLEQHPEIWLSVSATTRDPRAGEEEGVSYFFLPRDTFDALVESGGLLEWAEFASNCYGTCLLYTSPSPRDRSLSRMPSSA